MMFERLTRPHSHGTESPALEEDRVRNLILVKHALPEIVPHLPARQWRLSEEGRRRCSTLADRLAPYQPALIASSGEYKAVETAQIVANALGKPFEIADGLHEHDRSSVVFLSRQEFESAVAHLFEQPEALVFGGETASQAQNRFKKAVESLLAKYPEGSIAIVAHGTVIALFVAGCAGIDPFPFWQRLSLPSFVVLSLPDLKLIETVENIE